MVPVNGRVLRLDTATGSNVWEHAYGCAYRSTYPAGPRATPLVHDGFICGECGFGELRCLEAATGDRRWGTYAATGGEKGFFANVFMRGRPAGQGSATTRRADPREALARRLQGAGPL